MMKDIKFRVWHVPEKRMYFRGYQKWLHVLLCDDDKGQSGGQGIPVKRARYKDCQFMEWTGLLDKNGREIYEEDRIRITAGDRVVEETVGAVPDSFGSKNAHPLGEIFKKYGLDSNRCVIEVIGNSCDGSSSREKEFREALAKVNEQQTKTLKNLGG